MNEATIWYNMLFVPSLERSRRNFDGLQRDTSPHPDTLAGLLNGSPATSPDRMYSKVKLVTITWYERFWLVLYSAGCIFDQSRSEKRGCHRSRVSKTDCHMQPRSQGLLLDDFQNGGLSHPPFGIVEKALRTRLCHIRLFAAWLFEKFEKSGQVSLKCHNQSRLCCPNPLWFSCSNDNFPLGNSHKKVLALIGLK